MKVLIIENEKLLADSIQSVLERKGFEVECVYDGETGAEYAELGIYDLLILDEILASCNYGMVRETSVVEFLQNRPEKLEVVLTGRNPSETFLELADYVSEIHMRRHPYEKGIPARRGIEF